MHTSCQKEPSPLTRIICASFALIMVCGLCACGAKPVEPKSPVAPTTQESQVQATEQPESDDTPAENSNNSPVDFSTGEPWIASNVSGAIKQETPTNLKDDFYLYVNKDEMLSLSFEPGMSTAGGTIERYLQNTKDILALFTDGKPAESHDAKLAKTLYDLYLDWDGRNALGVTPLKDLIAPVEKITSIDELNRYFLSTPDEKRLASVFGYGMTGDLVDSTVYILAVDASSLLLKDSAEYTNLSEYGKLFKEVTDEMALYMLDRLGYSEDEAQKKLDNCYAFEKLIAPGIMTSDETKQPDYIQKINNHVSYEELEELQGKVPILSMADNTGYIRKETVLLPEPKWLEALAKEYNDDNIDLIKDYLIVHGVLTNTGYLDRECFEKTIEAGNKISGSQGKRADEEYALNAATSHLGWQVARLYCDRYVTAEDKKNVYDLCCEVKRGYEDLIHNNDFLSEDTKAKAIEKLRAITINSLYPDDWSPYSFENLELKTKEDGGTYFAAVKNIRRETLRKSVEKFKNPVNKNEWIDTPTTVNAYYNPTNNSINMLAAFCRGNLYHSDMSYEQICGTLGYVIGHEISHSFDGTGSQFDKDGNLCNWWTEEDKEKFSQKIQAIADYADTIYCWDDTHINGAIVTGEACADMGGVAVMLQIAKSHDGFDYDKFFMSCAKTWSGIDTYEYFLSSLTDTHPPKYFRVNGVLQQFQEFIDFYDIKEGDKMYLAPDKRVAIW